jgi:exodeoxyribonuclease III
MRILTWNCCHGDFTKRVAHIEHLKPDVAIIQESSRPKTKSPNVQWAKVSKHHGIAVRVADGFSITRLESDKPLHRCVHGYHNSGPTSFNLLACWTHDSSWREDYRQCWIDGIAAYEAHLKSRPVVVAGDFNDNSIWDRDYPEPCFESLLKGFREKHKIVSAYHHIRAEEHGKESRATSFHLKNRTKPYHIDYVLIPQAWIHRLTKVWVGQPNKWLKLSDHSRCSSRSATNQSLQSQSEFVKGSSELKNCRRTGPSGSR